MKLRNEKFRSIIIKMQQWSKRGDFIEVAPGWFENAHLTITEEITQLEAKNELYRQRIVFEQACRFADAQNDYDMAAYALRDLPLTKEAELADLAQAMQSEGCSKGDWVGLRDLWDKAYRKALGGER